VEQTVTETLSLGLLLCQLLGGAADCGDGVFAAMPSTNPCDEAVPRYELVVGGAQMGSDAAAVLEDRLAYVDACEIIATVNADGSVVLEIASHEDPLALVTPMLRPGNVIFYDVDESHTLDQPLADGLMLLPSVDRQRTYIVDRSPLLHDAALASAEADSSLDGDWTINLEFTDKGAEQFGDITTEMVGQLLAITLDGYVLSAPRINRPIYGGRAMISGGISQEESQDLAALIASETLPDGLTVLSVEALQQSE